MRVFPIFLLFACSSTEKETEGTEIENGTVLQDRDEDGYTADQDCDDNDDQINPGAEEVCDGIDNDCNGEADERVMTVFYAPYFSALPIRACRSHLRKRIANSNALFL